jgi:threonine synthase
LAIGCLMHLRCIVCGQAYPADDRLSCPACGPAEGILDAEFDLDKAARTLTREALAARPLDHWRYGELLPIADAGRIPPLHVGWTPLYDAPRLAAHLGVARLTIKDDGRNPTASFKDRASSVGVTKALEFGHCTIACASTGNAASSLAGCAASVGMRSFIFVPERAPEPKVAQLLMFGATVLRVRGTYDQAYDLCMAAAAEYGWYNRNCAVNPYLVEGKKTAGLEIAEQTGESVPDWVAVSVGDGCTIAGVWKGMREMHRIGMMPRLPRLLAVQADGSPAVVRQLEAAGEELLPRTSASTVADSICVATPRNWRKAVRAVRESQGVGVTVTDAAITDALRYTPRLTGVFGEPAGVAAIAGIAAARADGVIGASESVLAVVTGNGLKDIRSAIDAAGKPFDIDPNLDSLRDALNSTA